MSLSQDALEMRNRIINSNLITKSALAQIRTEEASEWIEINLLLILLSGHYHPANKHEHFLSKEHGTFI